MKLLIIIALLTLSVFGQYHPQSTTQTAIPESHNQSRTKIDRDNKVISIAAGTETLVDGSQTIEVDVLPKTYFVIITPLEECGQLYVAEKTEKSFTVRQMGDNSLPEVQFDYVVFANSIDYREALRDKGLIPNRDSRLRHTISPDGTSQPNSNVSGTE